VSPKRQLSLGIVVWIAMAIFCGCRFEMTHSIAEFVDAQGDSTVAGLSRGLADSELTRSVVLVVSAGGDSKRAVAGGLRLERYLREADDASEAPEIAWMRGGWDSGKERSLYDLYFPHRLHFLSGDPERELRGEISTQALRRAARELHRQLSLPTAPLVKRVAGADPLLAYKRQLTRLQAAQQGKMHIEAGRFVTAQGDAVVFLASRHSAFDTVLQVPLQHRIEAAFALVRTELGADIQLRQSSVGRFAIDAESRIRGDITRISVVSTLGIVLLFVVVLRSVRLMFLSMLPLLCGVLTATTVLLLVFGRIHGLTLAFGSSLIGVCIDYPIHLFNHRLLTPGSSVEETLRRVRPGLLLGAGTTVAGFAGLAWTSFPGIREIALFASTGVAGALLSTLLLLPALMPEHSRPGAVHRWLAERVHAALQSLERRRRWLIVIPMVSSIVCLAGLSQLQFVDDISALAARDPTLLAEEDEVRALVSRMDSGRMILAIADDEEQALRLNDEVARRLSRLVEDKSLIAFRSVHDFLWSEELQSKNRGVIVADPTFFGRFVTAFEEEGFRAQAFGEFEQEIQRGAADPLRFKDLEGAGLGPLVSSFRTTIGEKVALVTTLQGVADSATLGSSFEDLPGVVYFDQKALMMGIYARSRQQSLELMGLGLLCVFAMLMIRYRRLRVAVAAFVPALLAAGTTAAILALLGTPINLMHLVSLLLVLSMGVDYGVFLAESHERPGRLGRVHSVHPDSVSATVLSLVLACTSTVLAFGLLAMSSNPALRAIGLTTGIGVLISLCIAPTALILFDGLGGTAEDA